MSKPVKRPEKISFVVDKGCLRPSDEYAAERLRARQYHIGDVLAAQLSKQRSPGYNRLAHQLGTLCRQNIDAFSNYSDSHKVLKRLQIESGVACEENAIQVDGYGLMMHRIPMSLTFDSMDEGEFREAMAGLSRYIAETYWSGMDEDEIVDMARLMP